MTGCWISSAPNPPNWTHEVPPVVVRSGAQNQVVLSTDDELDGLKPDADCGNQSALLARRAGNPVRAGRALQREAERTLVIESETAEKEISLLLTE